MENKNNSRFTRRDFLRNVSLTALAGLSLPLFSSCSKEEAEDFLQKHFREMSPEEKKRVIAKLEERYFQKYGKKFEISTKGALPDTLWGYGLELSRCIGCRRCVYACVKENNNSRFKPQLHWIRVLRLKRGTLINLENSEHYYNPETVPEKGYMYLPVQCQHCENPPCVKVCPVHATWKEPDGLVVVDYNWCIGCRYCIAACPYKGRVFNWAEPNIPKEEINPSVHYLGNRPRMKCAVDKCTFCVQRVRNGRYPACVEACPTGTRKFGNLLDPNSEIRYIIDHKRVFRLKEDLNTEPKFYYFFVSLGTPMEVLRAKLEETWHFYKKTLILVAKGSKAYYLWCFFLLAVIATGFFFYMKQHEIGLIETKMADQVSWGLYIANFTYLVGMAAAAVLLVIPSYIYSFKPIKEIVVLGELFSASSIVMAILFVMVDLGRLDRFWHMAPLIGSMNFPQSLLAWDVLVLNGYLFLNLLIPVYLLVKFYYRKDPNWKFILPFILASVPWAVGIHTVTAFLYNGLAARPFWNASILAPRFLASALCSGPAIMIVIFQIIRKISDIKVEDRALFKIAELIAYAMFVNLFLLTAEIFKEYYSATVHIAPFQFLFEGLHGHNQLVPWIWAAMAMNIIAFVIFLIPQTRKRLTSLNFGCLLVIIGVWIEKGPGFVVPGFVPDPLGEIYVYIPNLLELMVSFGIWAVGLLVFTLLMKVAIPIETGEFSHVRYVEHSYRREEEDKAWKI